MFVLITLERSADPEIQENALLSVTTCVGREWGVIYEASSPAIFVSIFRIGSAIVTLIDTPLWGLIASFA